MQHARVKELFDYHPDGYLVRRVTVGNQRAGTRAGTPPAACPYWRIRIDRQHCLLHQVIYFWHYGTWPEYIDHCDRDKENNRIENLIDVRTSAVNGLNRGATRVSKTGVKGCFRRRERFIAQRVVHGRRIYLGTFSTPAEVAAAFERAGI